MHFRLSRLCLRTARDRLYPERKTIAKTTFSSPITSTTTGFSPAPEADASVSSGCFLGLAASSSTVSIFAEALLRSSKDPRETSHKDPSQRKTSIIYFRSVCLPRWERGWQGQENHFLPSKSGPIPGGTSQISFVSRESPHNDDEVKGRCWRDRGSASLAPADEHFCFQVAGQRWL
jgi:hypothetical protein